MDASPHFHIARVACFALLSAGLSCFETKQDPCGTFVFYYDPKDSKDSLPKCVVKYNHKVFHYSHKIPVGVIDNTLPIRLIYLGEGWTKPCWDSKNSNHAHTHFPWQIEP